MKSARLLFLFSLILIILTPMIVFGQFGSTNRSSEPKQDSTADYLSLSSDGFPLDYNQSLGGAIDNINGATPELTPAEKQMKADKEFEYKLGQINSSAVILEKRILQMRRNIVAPTRDELAQLTKDIEQVDSELENARPTGFSTASRIQWAQASDRIFSMKTSLSLMAQRGNDTNTVFGSNFFSRASMTTTEQKTVPGNYRVRPGDKLSIVVTSKLGGNDEKSVRVNDNGSVVLAGFGRTAVAGKTISEIRNLLANKVTGKFGQLRIQVSVDEVSSIQVRVAGDVLRPGTFTVSGFSTVLSALNTAGGPSGSGSYRKVSLIRDGEPKKVIDLYDFLLYGSKKGDFSLQDGDLLFVPPVGPTVTIAGEVIRPGRYEPLFPVSLGDILKLAGGVKSEGYLQAVQVGRVLNNEYKVLLSERFARPSEVASFAIQPGDEITVSTVKADTDSQVSISGPVKSPGTYGFQDKMKLSDLLRMAQGFATDKEVYGGRADVLRVDPLNGTSLITVNLDRAIKNEATDDIVLSKLDRVYIYEPEQVVFRPKLITIKGAVAQPGVYKRNNGMKISDVIAASGGVLPDAYLLRADLLRMDSEGKSTLVKVNVQEVLNGNPDSNFQLQDRDFLRIYSINDAEWTDRKVRIEGAVQRPGTYTRSEGMYLSDLLFAAGGLVPEASSSVEVAHLQKPGQSAITKVELVGKAPAPGKDVLLQDQDIVTVPAVNPCLRTPEIIYLTGEVANPGPYILSNREETLADMLQRAGGLTKYADINGLLFLRRRSSMEKPQQEKDSDIILERSRLFADRQFRTQLAKSGVSLPVDYQIMSANSSRELSKPTLSNDSKMNSNKPENKLDLSQIPIDTEGSSQETNTGAGTSETKSSAPETNTALGKPLNISRTNRATIDSMSSKDYTPTNTLDYSNVSIDSQDIANLNESVSRISVNLSLALKDAKSPDNMALRNGDSIFIPKVSNVVTVVGAVMHPHSFAASEGSSVKSFIDRSGGYSPEAARGSVIVVRTNGDAIPWKSVRKVQPGDIIVVPTTGLIDITKQTERVSDVTQILSQVLSSVYVLTKL